MKITINDFLYENIKNKEQILINKLLSFDGKYVKIGLEEEYELDRMINNGIIFENKIIILKGEFGRCHRNVATKYRNLKNKNFKIATGYALNDEHIWIQHSWGLDKNNILIETTGNKYLKYYGYILDKDESDDFCFYNY